ncbi:alveolar macrophage chemotactic factor [Xenopus laevis]|uniref:Chemokine interleukin-8-like domain-containing protein n=2 Tax=Xenopus laevis TaxID=8355 RepID=A0A974DZ01_XENLA|nr:alveolar macrophage chemotactic factor [Xenopus laevis]OCU00046.1 hypothetical protein XELAEV_18005828mg [Xenopus laevis]
METKRTVLAVLTLCLLWLTVTESMSLTRIQELRCLCIKTESKPIHPKHIKNIEVIPNGPHCKNVEVIITLTNGEEVCLEPSAPWVKKIIDKILASSKTPEPTPAV